MKIFDTSIKSNDKGFTIIELLIATAVFSVILLICAGAMIQVGRVYYKGITTIKTQEASRTVIDDISQAIQFAGGPVMPTSIVPPANNSAPVRVCIGSNRYTYILGAQRKNFPGANQRKHVLVKDNFPGCNASTLAQAIDADPLTDSSQELIPENMRLSRFDIVPNGRLYEVTVKVVSGENDVLVNTNDPSTNCLSSIFGAQFCSLSELQAVVQKRIP